MLDLQVAPERSVGNEQWEFVLGMPLYQAVQILQKHCRVINEVHVVYNDKNPFAKDIGLNLIHDGLRLLFDAESQRLKIIEVCDMKKVKLKYCGVYFNSPQVSPTIQQIDQSFGATHPAQFDEKHHMFVLTFRGITFDFPIEQQFEVASGFSLRSLPHTPAPVVSKMYIYTGNHLNETKAPPMPPLCYHGNLYSETTELDLKQGHCVGLKLRIVSGSASHLTDLKLETFDRCIHFQDSVEDILTEIGSPCQTFYKMEDKMRIHSAGPHKLSASHHSDYFYNYFTLGMDILFDGNTHMAKKFILHANHPGHYNFNIYYRCNFKVQLTGESGVIVITPTMKWSNVIKALGGPEMVTEPVVLNRASSTNTTNPFGFTYCYAIQNMIFEIMSNDYIASVTLFRPSKNDLG